MRLATGAVLLDTGLPGLVFSDQFLQLPVRLPAGAALYGLGEVAQVLHCSPLYRTVVLSSPLSGTNWTGGECGRCGLQTRCYYCISTVPALYPVLQPPLGAGKLRYNMYGVHPRYTVLEQDGKAHGVIFLNSAAQEVETLPLPAIVYRCGPFFLPTLIHLPHPRAE